MPSKEEVDSMIWNGIGPFPFDGDAQAIESWKLHVSTLQLRVLNHDWRHRTSCFKKGSTECRYHFPREPVERTRVTTKVCNERSHLSTTLHLDDDTDNSDGEKRELVIEIGKREPFVMIANSSIPLLALLKCNNFLSYVEN